MIMLTNSFVAPNVKASEKNGEKCEVFRLSLMTLFAIRA